MWIHARIIGLSSKFAILFQSRCPRRPQYGHIALEYQRLGPINIYLVIKPWNCKKFNCINHGKALLRYYFYFQVSFSASLNLSTILKWVYKNSRTSSITCSGCHLLRSAIWCRQEKPLVTTRVPVLTLSSRGSNRWLAIIRESSACSVS